MSTTPPIIEMKARFASGRTLETPLIRRLDAAIFWALCASLLFGPLAFGATEPWSLAVQQASSMLIFALWCSRQMAARAAIIQPSPLFLPAALFALVVASQSVLGTAAYRQAMTNESMEFVAYGVVLFVAVQLFYYGQRLRDLAAVFMYFGLAVSAFAILQGLTSNGMLYWTRVPRFSSAIYGPYVNRNHYAGLMEMLVPFALALCFSRRASAGKKLLAGFAALLMATSVFLSASRGGAASLIAELIFLGVIGSGLRKRAKLDWRMGLLFVAFVALLLWLDVGPFLDRWKSFQGDLHGGRAAISRDGWRMFLQRPLLGWGLGAFPFVYPEFRSFYTDYLINQAHNDYLQVLVETGALGAAAMVWFIVALYRRALGRLRAAAAKSAIDSGSLVRLAALTGCTGLLVHSFVDFNLHIPANAMLFFFLCAVACWGPASSDDPAAE